MVASGILMILIYAAIVVISSVVYHLHNTRIITEYRQSMDKQLEDHKKDLDNQYKYFANELEGIVQNQQEYMKVHKHVEKELFNTFLKIKESIKGNCYDTANNIGASRLAIYLFHNGSTSTHGISFVKMSCICEKISAGSGVKERLMEHSNVPVNLFDDMVEHLMDNHKYIVLNDDTNTCSESVRKLFISASKIKYSQLVSIFDQENNLLGFVCAEMMNPYSREQAIKEQEEIARLINLIRPVLTYSDYANVTLETPATNLVQHD